jgi:hypothetical protein
MTTTRRHLLVRAAAAAAVGFAWVVAFAPPTTPDPDATRIMETRARLAGP